MTLPDGWRLAETAKLRSRPWWRPGYRAIAIHGTDVRNYDVLVEAVGRTGAEVEANLPGRIGECYPALAKDHVPA